MTNNKLSSVENDVNARKQDFIALFNKADSTEHELEHVKLSINNIMAKYQNQTLLQMDNISRHLIENYMLTLKIIKNKGRKLKSYFCCISIFVSLS
jgi:hypothetical protein